MKNRKEGFRNWMKKEGYVDDGNPLMVHDQFYEHCA